MKLKRIAIAVAAILFASSAQAQVPPPVLQQAPVFGSFYLGARSPDVSATTTSGTSAVALGTAAGVAYVCNTGSNNAYFRLGASTITVTAANGIPLIAGQCGNFYAIAATHIVGITATSTATLQIAMGWGSAFAAGGGSGGGGGSVTQGTSPWVDNITQWASGALGAPSQFGTSPGAVNVPGMNAFIINSTTAIGNNSDNVTPTASGNSPVVSYTQVFDGANWDRWAGAVTATLSAETTKVVGTVRNLDGAGNNINADPCERAQQTSTPISITTATTTRIVAPSASNKTYICYMFITSAAADNVGIVEGTGGTCGTGTAGVVGGTTAANGPNVAANSGFALSAGGKVAAAVTTGTNVDLCLITSAATPLAGVIKWVQAP